jgi:hypothetical protein
MEYITIPVAPILSRKKRNILLFRSCREEAWQFFDGVNLTSPGGCGELWCGRQLPLWRGAPQEAQDAAHSSSM